MEKNSRKKVEKKAKVVFDFSFGFNFSSYTNVHTYVCLHKCTAKHESPFQSLVMQTHTYGQTFTLSLSACQLTDDGHTHVCMYPCMFNHMCEYVRIYFCCCCCCCYYYCIVCCFISAVHICVCPIFSFCQSTIHVASATSVALHTLIITYTHIGVYVSLLLRKSPSSSLFEHM